MGAVEKGISTIIRDEAGPGSSTAPCGASKTLMPKSTPSRVSAATAVVAQPTATAKRDSLLRCISARPRAVRPVRQRLKDIGADVVSPERRSSEYLQKFVEAQVEK